MKNKTLEIIYYIRLMLFIFHIIMIYMMLDVVVHAGILGHIFLIIDIVYIIKILFEFLSKRKRYYNEIYYNIMQIGLFTYLIVFWSRICFNDTIYTIEFTNYLKNNFILLIILFVFLILYSVLLIGNKKFTKNPTKKNKDL